jgi:hypothetical protein
VKERLKALLGERGRGYARRLGRLRYPTKARKARAAGWTPRTHPGGWLREVVLSPEVDTYSYEVANREELAAVLADVLDRPPADTRAALEEVRADPELGERLARDVGHRVLWLKRRPPLAAHHLSMWVAVRLLRPRLVVETGVLDGLGSRTILRALERNAAEGHDGRLVSFDVLPTAGALVPPRLAGRWERIIEPCPEGLARLGDATVDVFLHDSLPTPEQARAELGWALDHGCGLAINPHGWTGVAEELAAARGGRAVRFAERPDGHFYEGRQIAYLLSSASTRAATTSAP